MLKLTDAQKATYFQRSYTTVDGLWFVKLEELSGFENALDIDTEVWKVMPKIQARFMKSVLGRDTGIEALRECLTARLDIEGFEIETQPISGEKGFEIIIHRCPWFELMKKSGREQLAGKVGARICPTEYGVWASEFGKAITFSMPEQLCANHPCCRFIFKDNA